MSTRPRRDTQRIAEEAAEWIEALEDGDAATQAQFAAWLKVSPRHVEEILIMKALDVESRKVDREKRFDIQEILANAGANVIPLSSSPGSPPKAPSRFMSWRWAASLAAVSLIGAAVWFGVSARQWQTYETAINEQRSLELEDGSMIEVNTHSRLKVRLSDSQREIRLLSGEALFKVARDAKRPFRVVAGETVIQAIGTQFNVYRRTSDTTVSVLEGLVSISKPHAKALMVPAGEGARLVPNGEAIRTAVEPAAATAWQQRRLMFRDKTLFEIAEEFNRYNRTPRLVVEGESLRNRTYGGTFDANDPRSLLDFIRPEPGISIDERKDEWVIRGK